MTLTEFLLARISEDEAPLSLPEFEASQVNREQGYGSRGLCPICGAYLYDGTESSTQDGWEDHAELVHNLSRVLADCAAKRRIIELTDEASNLDMSVDLDRRVGPRDMIEEPYVGDAILAALALPYADHPDYPGEQQK